MKIAILGLLAVVSSVSFAKVGLEAKTPTYKVEITFSFPDGAEEETITYEGRADCDTMWETPIYTMDIFRGSRMFVRVLDGKKEVGRASVAVDITSDRVLLSQLIEVPLNTGGDLTHMVVFYPGNLGIKSKVKSGIISDVEVDKGELPKLAYSFISKSNPRPRWLYEDAHLTQFEY